MSETDSALGLPAERRPAEMDPGIGARFGLPAFPPTRRPRRNLWRIAHALVVVVLPTLVGIVYFGWIAADQYETVATFGLHDSGQGTQATSQTSLIGPPSPSGDSSTQSYGIVSYIGSLAAVHDVADHGLDARALLSSSRADFVTRLAPGATEEALLRAWQRMVVANYEISTGIVTLRVRGYTARDSLRLSAAVIESSERLVNAISLRMRQDSMRFAEHDVEHAEQQVLSARAELERFRLSSGVLDPTKSTDADMTLLVQLRENLAAAEAQAMAMRASGVRSGPVLDALQVKAAALRAQVAGLEQQVASSQHSGTSWSAIMNRYETLNTRVQLAEKYESAALSALQDATSDAARQISYLLTYERPVLPQQALYPMRVVWPCIIFGASVLAWAISLLLFYAIRDHG